MKKNQNGFTFIELLLILVILSATGFIGWKVYQKVQSNSGDDIVSSSETPKALLFAKFSGLSVDVDSYDLNSGQKKQLLQRSVSEPNTRSNFSEVLDAKISSDKQLVAYRFGNEGKIKIIKSDGADVRTVPRGNVSSFEWLHNERQLALEVTHYVDCPNCGVSAGGSDTELYIYDIDNGKETRLDVDNKLGGLEGQSANTLYFGSSSPYGNSASTLYAYNLDSRKVNEIKLPDEEGIQIGFIESSPDGKRTIVSILPRGYGTDHRCTIYELQDNKLSDKLVDEADHQCENAYWVNNDEFYFDNSTGLNGKISTSDTTPSGYYILFSVYRYSFSSHSAKKILAGNSSEVYRLAGALPDGSFIVSNEAATGGRQYKLQVRNADGSLKTSVETSPKEILFIGSIN